MSKRDNGDEDLAKSLEAEADEINARDKIDLITISHVMEDAKALADDGLFDQPAYRQSVDTIRKAIPDSFDDYLEECKTRLLSLLR